MKYVVFVNKNGDVVTPCVRVLEDALTELGDYGTVFFPSHWTNEFIDSVSSFSGTNLVQKFGNPLLQGSIPKGSKLLRLRSKNVLSKAIRSHCVSINEAAAECINGDHGRFLGVKDCLLVITNDSETIGEPVSSLHLFKEGLCARLEWKMLQVVEGNLEEMQT